MIRLLIARPWWSTLKRLLLLTAMNAAEIVTKVITGNPVAFITRMAGNLKELSVDLSPIQNGTPTPENPVTIEKHGQIKMLHYGRNLIQNKLTDGGHDGITWSVNSDGSVNVSGTAEADILDLWINPTGKANRYTVAYENATLVCNGRADYNPQLPTTNVRFQIDMYARDGDTDTYLGTIQSGSPVKTCEGKEILVSTVRIWIKAGTVIPEGTVFYPQLEVGSEPTAYEPYNPESAALTLIGNANIYGGTLMPVANPESGSDMGMMFSRWKESTISTVSEILTTASGTGKYVYIPLPSDAQANDQIKCVYMEVAEGEAKASRTCAAWTTYVSGNTIVVFVPSDATSESAAAALTGAKFIYMSAIQSSYIQPVEIPVFEGGNTYSINADCTARYRYLTLE